MKHLAQNNLGYRQLMRLSKVLLRVISKESSTEKSVPIIRLLSLVKVINLIIICYKDRY